MEYNSRLKENLRQRIFDIISSYEKISDDNKINFVEDVLGEIHAITAQQDNNEERNQSWNSLEHNWQITEKQLILDSISDMVIFHDLDFNVKWLNKAAARFAGKASNDIYDMKCFNLFGEDNTPCESSALEETRRTGLPFETIKQRHDGRIWQIRTFPSIDSAGKIVGVVETVTDITERKSFELKLTQNEQYLRAILQTTTDGFWVVDKNRRKVDVNDAYLAMSGYTREEFLKLTVNDVDVEEDIKQTQERIKRIIKNGSEIFETRHRRKDGSIFDVEVSATYIERDGGLFVCFCRDITQRKQWQQKLVVSDRVFNHALDMLCIAGFDGYFKTLNPAWSKTLGWSKDELLSKPWVEFVHPDDRKATGNIQSVIVDGEEVYHFENRYICKDGSVKWLSWNSFPYPCESVMFGVARDITYKKQAEEKLFQSELKLKEQVEEYLAVNEELNQANEELRNLMENLSESTQRNSALVAANPDIMFVYNRDGVFLDYHTPNPKELLLKPEEFLYKRSSEVLPKYLADINQQAINQLFETGKPQTYSYSVEIMGNTLHYDARMVRYGKDKALAIVRDITEKKKAEEELALMASMLDLAPSAITVHDFQGNFLYTNQHNLNLHGFRFNELMKMNLHEIDTPENEEQIEERINIIKKYGEATFEVEHFRKDGTTFPLKLLVKQVVWKGQPALLSIGSDITEQKRVESVLRDSEMKYRRIAENISDVIWTADLNFNTTYLSPSVERLIGESVEKQLQRTMEEKHPPESLKIMESFINEELEREKDPSCDKNRTRIIEVERYRANGSLIWISMNVSFIRDNNGIIIGLQGVTRDITAQKLAEKALRESEERYRSLYESTPAMLHSIDKEGKIISVSNTWLQKLGYAKDEVIGRKSIDFLTEESKRMAVEVYLPEFFKKGISKDVYYQMVTRNGEILDVLMSAVAEKTNSKEFVRSMAVIEDITERKKAEKALRESEHRFQLSMEATKDGLWDWNVATGEVYYSPAYFNMLGYEVGGFASDEKSFLSMVHPDDSEIALESNNKCITGETESFEVEFRMKTKGGDWHWILSRGKCVERDKKGKAIRIVGTHVDITDRKKAEEALKISEKQIQRKLNNILSAEISIDDFELIDIINTDAIQSLMDDFYSITKVPVAIIDLKGKVLVGTGWQDICTKFHRIHPETHKSCIECDTMLTKGVKPGEFKSYLCKNSLWDNVTPLMVGGKHVGNLFTGQFFYKGEKPDDKVFIAQAEKYGFDLKEYMDAVSRVPIWNREDIKTALTFYSKLANIISSLSHANLALAKSIEERKQNEMALKESEEKYRTLFEKMREGVFYQDADGKLIDANQATFDLFGLTQEQFFGRTSHHPEWKVVDFERNILPPEKHPSMLALSTRKPVINQEVGVFNPQKNDYTWMLVNAIPQFVGSNKKPHSVFVTLSDITSRKNFEETLKQRNTFIQTVLDNLPIGVALNTINEGKATYINKKFVEIYGWPEEELLDISRFFEKVYPDPDYRKELMQRIMADIQSGDPEKMRWENIRATRKDGSLSIINAVNIPLVEQNTMVSTVIDVTKEMKAEQALRESEAKYRLLIENQNDLVVKVDVNNNFLYVSPSYCKVFGKSEEELLNNSFMPLVHPDDIEHTKSEMKKLFHHPHSCFIEQRANTIDGWRWFSWTDTAELNEQGEVLSIIGVGRDITVQKQAELALRESEERFRGLYENATVGIYRTTPDGRITMANTTLVKMLGYESFEELAQRDLTQDGYEPDYKRENFIKLIDVKGEVKALESEWKRKDGKAIFVSESARVVRDENGRHLYYEGIVEDISERRKAIDALKASEERIKSIFRVAPTGIGVVKDRVITEVNPMLCEMTGYKPEELLGKSARMLYPTQEEFEYVGTEKYRQIAEKGTGTVETRWVKKDGTVINIILSSTPIYEDDLSQGISFTAMDISGRKQMEINLRQSEEKFRLLFENMTQGFALHEIITDEKGKAVNYRYLDTNPAFERLTGLKANNIIGKTIIEVLPNTERYWIETYGKVAETGKSIRYENYARELGKYFDVSAFCPERGLFAVVFSDITERKLAEEKVQMLSKGIEQSPAIVVITDVKGNIEFINPKFSEVTGYSLDEVMGKNPRILKSGRQNDEFYHKLWSTILKGNDWQGEMINRKKSGKEYWESALISPIKDEKGDIKNFIAIKEDITERKNAEQALIQSEQSLKEKNEQYLALNEELVESYEKIQIINQDLVKAREKAEESDKLKTAFLANMSHEIRTPMNAIIGFSEFLLKPNLPKEKQEFFSVILNTSCHQLLNVVNDMIDIAKIETGQVDIHLGKANINQVITRICSIYSPQAQQKDVKINQALLLSDEFAEVLTDTVKLNQILTNLVTNALKFTEQGFVEVGYIIKNEFIEFYVKDTGIGIDPVHHEIIFERFRQVEIDTTRKYGGTGLGLSISKAFAEMLGGKIWLDSELDMGSTFYFTLPYKPFKQVELVEKSEEAIAVNFKGKLILLAEDEYANYLYVNDVIEDTGANLLYAKNGREAVDLLRNNPEIELIIMDIKMPEMDGIAATQAIRKIGSKIPIIALTAYALSGDKERCLEAGCNSYLSKPILRADLLREMEKLLKL